MNYRQQNEDSTLHSNRASEIRSIKWTGLVFLFLGHVKVSPYEPEQVQ